MSISKKQVDEVVIRFAGDSGDGMQLTGGRFTETTAVVGNDLSTLPDFPAEIRAPAGSLAGVSAFQIKFSSKDIHTPGDVPDVLVAMNPAALKVHQSDVPPGGTIICNSAAFNPRNLKLAGYDSNPLEDKTLDDYFTVYSIDMSRMVSEACKDLDLSPKLVDRSKNFYALGLLFWMYDRPLKSTEDWLAKKFAKKPEIIESNVRALNAGYNYGETTEIFTTRYTVDKANLPPGKYRNVVGNYALSMGLAAAAERSKLELFLGSYPITPASDILHTLSAWKHLGIKTFQAEDEIAGIASAIGAAFGGSLAITTTSGPGVALKTEAMGLAVMTELPLVIINIQRGGPSTGLPTKTEQADLFQAIYGRNGEAPIPVIATSTPSDCFYLSIEAAKIALKYMTPVMLLSDGYIANGSEPWKLPNVDELETFHKEFRTEVENFNSYDRDENLARPWAVPGTPGLEHRIGGLEKHHITGNVSYDPDNHDFMVRLRAQKVAEIVKDVPDLEVRGDQEGELLVLGWGGTYGAITEAVDRILANGMNVSQAHLKYLNPFPKNLGDVLSRFKTILIPELNLGQLATVIRATYLREVVSLTKIKGLPFKSMEVESKISEILGGSNGK